MPNVKLGGMGGGHGVRVVAIVSGGGARLFSPTEKIFRDFPDLWFFLISACKRTPAVSGVVGWSRSEVLGNSGRPWSGDLGDAGPVGFLDGGCGFEGRRFGRDRTDRQDHLSIRSRILNCQ